MENTEDINVDNDEHLIQDFRASKFEEKKHFPLKFKIIIAILISVTVILIATLVVFILIKEFEKPNGDGENKDEDKEEEEEEEEEDTIEILPPVIINSTSEYNYCIIWLHGVDNHPENFVNQFKYEIPYLKKENTKVILMRAPVQYVNIYGTNTTSWFNILCNPINRSECYNFTDATISKRMLVKVIKQEAKILNGKYQNIFIGGHSQGAIISLYTAYSIKQLLGGVLICSGILFPETEIVGDKNKLKVFIGHGYGDRILPMYFHNETIKRIENYEGVERHYYEGIGHGIGALEKLDMGGFLNASMI